MHSLTSCDVIIQMDYDMVDYLNELRDACLEAYTGVLQGLRGPDAKSFSREITINHYSCSYIVILHS